MNNYSLIFDGVIILVIIISALAGRRKGIVDTALRLIGLVGALFLAVTFTRSLAALLEKTPVRDFVYGRVLEAINEYTYEATDYFSNFLGGGTGNLMQKGKELLASGYTDSIVNMLSFICILIVTWIIVMLIRNAFKRSRKNSRIIGSLDGLAGMLLGILKGMLIASIFVALIIPVTTLLSPFKLPEIIKGLRSSFIAWWIYDTNPILVLIKNLILG
ncbi:MAG: CvpA family protein [Clostridiales bacterium]|nr:CvpA family protein [Clostridiales bacterium]